MTTHVAGVILYMAEEDLYRLGNSTSPKLDHLRPRDVDSDERNGITGYGNSPKGWRYRMAFCSTMTGPAIMRCARLLI